MRLIDADALVEAIVNTPSEVVEFHTYNVLSSLAERQHEILDLIENQPTVDAVPVVRCKDCKYSYGSKYCTNEAWKDEYNTVTIEPDTFCSYGEKRNEHET